MKILFLSANPSGTARLNLDKEVRKIEDGLKRSRLRDQFQLVSNWEVDSDYLRRALLEENPDIVHFSGHGEGQAGLVLVGQDGRSKPATGEALAGLFKQFSNVKCVVLNACYAEVQAKAIVQHVDYVVGMKQAVRDDAAIAFATGFYDGLGYGKSIEIAFELGRNAIEFERASFSDTIRSRKLIPVDFENVEPLLDHLIPVLLKKETASTEGLISSPLFSETSSSPNKPHAQNSTAKAGALRTYRERVQEFLADLKLTQIERFQLAILANVLGLSEADANQILQEELNKLDYNARSSATSRSWFQRVSNAKKYLLVCVAILATSAGGFLTYKQTTANVSNDGRFIVNLSSEKCIDVSGAPGTVSGTRLHLWDCERSGFNRDNGSPTDQKWILGSDGFIRNTLSGRCLDVDGSPGTASGARLTLSDCETSRYAMNRVPTDQRWTLEPNGFIKNTLSEKCLDVDGSLGTANGAPLILSDCETSGYDMNRVPTDQRWGLQ